MHGVARFARAPSGHPPARGRPQARPGGARRPPKFAGISRAFGWCVPAARRVKSGGRPVREAPPRAHLHLRNVVSFLCTHGRRATRGPGDSRAPLATAVLTTVSRLGHVWRRCSQSLE